MKMHSIKSMNNDYIENCEHCTFYCLHKFRTKLKRFYENVKILG